MRGSIVTGLGRNAPTVIITNDHDLPTKALIAHYARRIVHEQRLAEIIQAFHADALSSAVNLNVDLDIMLCVLAQARRRRVLRNRLPGYRPAADVLQRRFLETPAPSSPTTTPGPAPSASTDAPTHPCSAKPTSPPTPKCPGGATAPSTTNSADPLPRTSTWKSAFAQPPALGGARRDWYHPAETRSAFPSDPRRICRLQR